MSQLKKALLMFGLITICGQVATAEELTDLEKEQVLSGAYLKQMKAEPNTIEVQDGVLLREVFKSDSTEYPAADSRVKVLYQGFDREGMVFDSAFQRDRPISFSLSRLISCWKIAIPQISVGSVYKVTCPAATAYGNNGAGSKIKPGAALSFRIIVLEILED